MDYLKKTVTEFSDGMV